MTRIPEALRKQVQARANQRCEYCLKPDSVTVFGHQVDHIIPVKHGGETTLENLAYACLKCNKSKGTDVAVYDLDTNLLIPLYNPRTQKWSSHFDMVGAVIVGKTPIGRVTVRILQVNESRQVEARRNLMQQGLW